MGPSASFDSLRRTTPHTRQRPSNLPLSNICSPDLNSAEAEKLEPYDDFLVHLNGDNLQCLHGDDDAKECILKLAVGRPLAF